MADIKKVMGQGALTGAVESGTIMGTTMMGAKLAPTLPGPLGVVSKTTGAVVGFGAGLYLAGKEREFLASKDMTYASIEDVPPELRPYAVAGETLGGAVTISGGVLALARTGMRTAGQTVVGRYVNNVLDTAKAHPFLFGTGELASATGAAAGGGMAEAYAPGNIWARLGAETAGGFFNPTRLVISGTKMTYNTMQTLYERLTPAGRETAAAKIMSEILNTRNEDPAVISQLLRVYDPNITTDVAQITGSPTLGALSKELAKHSNQYGAESQMMAENGLEALFGQIDIMRRAAVADGSPEALQVVAQAEALAFRTLMTDTLVQAEQTALAAAGRITADTPAARMDISKVARDALNQSLKLTRDAESELWSQVPETAAAVDNLASRFKDISDDLLPELRGEQLPSFVRAFLKRAGAQVDDVNAPTDSLDWPDEFKSLLNIADDVAEGAQITTKDLTQLRSALLDLSRTATEKGEYNAARIYSELAESALNDLDAAFTGDAAYATARTFSRELNETFTRSFAGKATAQGRFGDRIAPELLLNRATAAGPEATALQMQELEEATRFLVKQGLSEDTAAIDAMMGAQERFIRLAAAESITDTGAVDVKKLTKFMENNAVMLDRFPEVRKVLDDAINTDLGREAVKIITEEKSRVFESQSAFAQVLNRNPVDIAKTAIVSSDPEKELAKLIEVAKSSKKPETLDAARVSILDAAMQRATQGFAGDKFNFDKFEQLLFKSPSAGKKSVIRVMQENGLVTAKQVADLKTIIKQAKNIGTAMKPGTAIDVADDTTGTLMTAVIRALGATLATKGSQATGTKVSGHTLIIAGTGARAMENIVNKIPGAQVKNILIEAMTNPDLMRRLLDKAPDPEKQMENFRFVHAYLIQAGIINPATTEE